MAYFYLLNDLSEFDINLDITNSFIFNHSDVLRSYEGLNYISFVANELKDIDLALKYMLLAFTDELFPWRAYVKNDNLVKVFPISITDEEYCKCFNSLSSEEKNKIFASLFEHVFKCYDDYLSKLSSHVNVDEYHFTSFYRLKKSIESIK